MTNSSKQDLFLDTWYETFKDSLKVGFDQKAEPRDQGEKIKLCFYLSQRGQGLGDQTGKQDGQI